MTLGLGPTSGPVVEFGLCNATMHKLDEAVALDDVQALVKIYAGVLARI